MTQVRPIFAIFEGGGAKGIAHIGALKALETDGFKLVGVAGTSAGALVAALAAAGYQADDILNPDIAGNNILTRYGSDPTALLGKKPWRTLGRASRGARRFGVGLAVAGLAGAFLVAPRTALVAARIRRNHGFLSTYAIREFLNYVLRERLLDLHVEHGLPRSRVPERITFRDLDYETFYPRLVPLKIVATNLRAKSLTIFDRASSPGVEIAQAVAASIAIPLVFEPVMLTSFKDPGPFVDGGLVSNFPTWVFTEEKLAFERANSHLPPVQIAGFTLLERPRAGKNASSPGAGKSFLDYVGLLANTAIFGSQAVSQRFIEDLIVAPLEIALRTLDFDADWHRFRQAYTDGHRCAAERLKSTLVIKPDRVRELMSRAFGVLKTEIDSARSARGAAPIGVCRINLIERHGRESFRVTHAFNMEGDADDRMIVDPRSKGAPEAFARREPVLLRSGSRPLGASAAYMTKYERALVRRTLLSAICVPVFKDASAWSSPASQRPEPQGVMSFDSDDDLADDFADDDIKRILAENSVLLSAALTG